MYATTTNPGTFHVINVYNDEKCASRLAPLLYYTWLSNPEANQLANAIR